MTTLTTPICEPLAQGDDLPNSSRCKEQSSKNKANVTITGIFGNQVAGHRALLKAENGIVCKPFAYQEWWFYNTVLSHPAYLPWTVHMFGYIQFTQAQLVDWVKAIGSQQDLGEGGALRKRAWTKEVYDRLMGELERVQQTTPANYMHRYMVMEDLCADFIHPCTIDVKMGTRMYGDNASEEKIRAHILKCQQSTSASLGIRLCGYKTWKPNEGITKQVNKFMHRDIGKSGVLSALFDFFHSGVHFRKDVLANVLDQMRALEKAVASDRSFRIYSSSLLIIYEGDKDAPLKVKVKIVDFAHTHAYENQSVENDDGFLFGVANLIQALEQVETMAHEPKAESTTKAIGTDRQHEGCQVIRGAEGK